MVVKRRVGCVITVAALAAAPAWAAQHRHADASKTAPAMAVHSDADYVDMMLMHHDQGIEMAKIAAGKTQRAEVRAFANTVVSGQQEDKKELEGYKTGMKTGTSGTSGAAGGHDMAGMSGMPDMKTMPEMQKGQQDIERLQKATGAEVDRLFLASMAQHHQQAIQMSRKAKPTLKDANVRRFADKTITKQTREIGEIKTLQSGK